MFLVICLAAVIAGFIVGLMHTEIETRKQREEAAWDREMRNYYREDD